MSEIPGPPGGSGAFVICEMSDLATVFAYSRGVAPGAGAVAALIAGVLVMMRMFSGDDDGRE